ncbi:MAG: DNA adenine methyltransferase YhdJ [Syntrophomonadaceae bacterium]|nr:DNA adenine methyltransferase YhdJ [Bacillota bacterium]
MRTYYQDDLIKIYNADSQNLSFIEDASVYLVITSPPYNTGIDYDNHYDRMSEDKYCEMLENVFRECYRVLVFGGRLCVNVPSCIKQHTYTRIAFLALDLTLMLRRIGFLDREWLTWVKMEGGVVPGHSTAWGSWKSPSNPYLRDGSEYIVIFSKEKYDLEGDKEKIDITTKEFLRFSTNVWTIHPTREAISNHPAAFPEELPYRLIKLYSYVGNTILDPFAGSGTVGVVAKRLKRKAILVDISERYCEVSSIKCGQGNLF